MAETMTLKTAAREPGVPFPETLAVPCVREYHPSDAARWDGFVRCEASASFFHLTGWMKVMQETFGYNCCSIYAERDGRITGVLPLFLIKNWILGRCLISTPLAVYGGIAASDHLSYLALLRKAQAMAEAHQVQYLELRNGFGEIEPGFHRNPRYVTFTCELSRDPELQLKCLPKDTRYMIRKAQKQGLQAVHGLDQFAEFYELFALNLQRHGTPVFPKSLFRNLINEFPGEIDLLMLYSGRKAVSGVFTFLHGDAVLPYYSGAAPEAPKLAANNLLYWELMEWAIPKGYRCFDFGRSKTGTGSYNFKTQWNMTITPLPYQVYLVEKREMPDFSPANPRFQVATRAWSRLPLWVTKQLGPHLVRWFP